MTAGHISVCYMITSLIVVAIDDLVWGTQDLAGASSLEALLSLNLKKWNAIKLSGI